MRGKVSSVFDKVWQEEHGLTRLLLLFAAFFLSPLLDGLFGRIVGIIFLTMLMLTGMSSFPKKTLIRVFVGLLTASSILLIWLQEISPHVAFRVAGLSVSLSYFIILTIVVLHNVFTPGPISKDRVQGAIAAYLLLGICWSYAYQLVDMLVPGSFSINQPSLQQIAADKRDLFGYFSFVTLTTLGYGDITPVHTAARMLTVVEALVGQLYPATLLARLVANLKMSPVKAEHQ